MTTEEMWEAFRDSEQFDPDGSINEQLSNWLGYNPIDDAKGSKRQSDAIAGKVRELQARQFNGQDSHLKSRQVKENSVDTENRANIRADDLIRDPRSSDTKIDVDGIGNVSMEQVTGAYERVYRKKNGKVSSRKVFLQGKGGKILGTIDRSD